VTGVSLRLLTLDDVPELAAVMMFNREHLAPTSPTTSDDAFTEAGVRTQVLDVLGRHELGLAHPMVIVDEGAIVGRINLNSIIRGAAQSASVGYWVAEAHNGRGVATAALAAALAVGFDELGLHRVQGEILPHNRASQVVLERNGFERYGYAPRYLRIAGEWQDHVLYQRVNDGWTPPA
jgi:[ribosomal protein S5]-alanine N-acetyltransferase